MKLGKSTSSWVEPAWDERDTAAGMYRRISPRMPAIRIVCLN
jgi:hypothetical protein